jgi:hypothetical protein
MEAFPWEFSFSVPVETCRPEEAGCKNSRQNDLKKTKLQILETMSL